MTFYTGSRFHTNFIEQDDFTHSFLMPKGYFIRKCSKHLGSFRDNFKNGWGRMATAIAYPSIRVETKSQDIQLL